MSFVQTRNGSYYNLKNFIYFHVKEKYEDGIKKLGIFPTFEVSGYAVYGVYGTGSAANNVRFHREIIHEICVSKAYETKEEAEKYMKNIVDTLSDKPKKLRKSSTKKVSETKL